jgi:hypothetical protein
MIGWFTSVRWTAACNAQDSPSASFSPRALGPFFGEGHGNGPRCSRPFGAVSFEAFIDKELQPRVQTSPADFYEEIFRLRSLNEETDSGKGL